MLDTVGRFIQGLSNPIDANFLSRILSPIGDRYSSQPLASAGLVINGAGAAFAKIGATDFWATAGGILVKLAAGTAMPALTGIVIPAAAFNVACFFVDGAGVITVAGGSPGATAGAVGWPQFPLKKALVGFVLITNAGVFTGGTTALDAGTTVYISPIGAFDPTVMV